MTATLDSVDLGNITSVSRKKTGNIIQMPIPTQDSDETKVYDYLGAAETIIIMGYFMEDTVALTRAKVYALTSLINGYQDEPRTLLGIDQISYFDTNPGDVKGLLAEVNVTWEVDTVGAKASYDLKIYLGIK